MDESSRKQRMCTSCLLTKYLMSDNYVISSLTDIDYQRHRLFLATCIDNYSRSYALFFIKFKENVRNGIQNRL